WATRPVPAARARGTDTPAAAPGIGLGRADRCPGRRPPTTRATRASQTLGTSGPAQPGRRDPRPARTTRRLTRGQRRRTRATVAPAYWPTPTRVAEAVPVQPPYPTKWNRGSCRDTPSTTADAPSDGTTPVPRR